MGTTAFTAYAGVLKREVDRRELLTDTQNGNGKPGLRFDCLLTPETSARKETAKQTDHGATHHLFHRASPKSEPFGFLDFPINAAS
jgi:hypothetical protein